MRIFGPKTDEVAGGSENRLMRNDQIQE